MHPILRCGLRALVPLIPAVLSLAITGHAAAHAATAHDAAAPKVVASIKPVHSLVAGVMRGIGEPRLLVREAASPHTYSLRPSEAQALADADLVFWVGEDLETFLERPLGTLAANARSVALMDRPGLTLRATREGGIREPHAGNGHDHGHDHDHGHEHAPDANDAHIWLDPGNARLLVDAIADELSAADPANAAGYRANAEDLSARIGQLDDDLRSRLGPVADRPFVVFHDGYRYFEDRYGLNAIGAITVSPDRQPGAGRLAEIRTELEALGAVCVFAEPQFEAAVIDSVVEGMDVRRGVLDPLGAGLQDGPELYFDLMRGLADGLADCLEG
ncbi:MAG TPA: zinc ABC transporter substrate-binding protein [Arenibaculum sp.]|nr:zinc ABC transporter substrate-binding protein [Arenibaculum sp.]